MKNAIGEEVPAYWQPAWGTMIDYYRQIVNKRKWRNYHVITYKDLYDAYDNIYRFELMLKERVPYDYNEALRKHLVLKANQKFVNHGQDRLLINNFLEDHHTMHTIMIGKTVAPLKLLYKKHIPFEKIDDYLTIQRNFYYE